MTVIQEVLLVAVHAQPFAAVTETVAVPALAPSVALTGDSTKVQATPSWLTVNARPAIVSVPLRGDVDVLAVTE